MTIKFKLLFLIISTLVIATISILVVVDMQFVEVIDQDQYALYNQRVDSILGILQGYDERLQMTGQVEAYSDGFRESAIEALKKTYYLQQHQGTFPFILNHDDGFVMSPKLHADELSLVKSDIVSRMQSSNMEKSGSFELKKRWYFYKRFAHWNWVVAYTVPLEIKYAEVQKLRNILISIMIGITTLSILIMWWAITRITKPIVLLTQVTRAIAAGNYASMIDVSDSGEVGQLAHDFNKMTEAVNKKIIDLNGQIDERQRAEAALKEKTKFLDQIIETSALSMWISDEKGTAIRTNPACLEFFGATEEEVVGKYNLFKDDVIKKKGLMPEVQEVFEKGKPASFIIDYDFGTVGHVDVKNATHKTIKTVLTPVLDTNKKVSNVIVQAIDITEIKQSEEETIRVNKILAEHEKLSLVGQVAGKMAHDFNNILGIIMGNTELSLVDCKDATIRKTLELIFEQTLRGRNLTKNLVAFAKDQEPKQEFFTIDEKIELVISLLKKDLEGINVNREYGHGLPELLADPGMIEHAIVNLVQNSIHAISLVEQPKIIFRTYQQNERVFIEIEDNGCGIPQEFLGEIFKPSFTLKGSNDQKGMYKPGIKGTGYGMSNVKKYVEQHKGEISIFSELQKGSKVTISLPVIKKELSTKEIEKVKKEKNFFGRYILLVEDEQSISDIYYRILTHEPCNHKVDIAGNGQIAIDLLSRNQYDLISLDYILPGEFNGMDVYRHVRKTNKNIPILFISGNIEFIESIKELKQKDANIDHLSKPCMNIDFVSGVNKLFGAGSS